jgi:hypothetical protein
MGPVGSVSLTAALENNATSLRDCSDMPVAIHGKCDFLSLASRIERTPFRRADM